MTRPLHHTAARRLWLASPRGVRGNLARLMLGVLAVAVVGALAVESHADVPAPQQVAHLSGFEWVGHVGQPDPRDFRVGFMAIPLVGPPAPEPQPARVFLPPRPPTSFAEWAIHLPVPLIRQIGDKSNCGPSAAAMAVGAYDGAGSPASLRDLRNAIGEWTWQRFPRRQRRLEGSDAGGTTRSMMQQSLNRFGEPTWSDTRHAWVPSELWSVITLRRSLAERRPLVVLAEAAPLWGIGVPGLHWVVVTGFKQGQVLMHDPADGREAAVSLETFWRAWRLPDQFHAGPGRDGYEGLVADRSLDVPLTVVPKPRHLAFDEPQRL